MLTIIVAPPGGFVKKRLRETAKCDILGDDRNGAVHRKENTMIDFDEELKKYVPSMEISEAEEAVLSREISDAADVIERILQEKKEL
jgi:hypothetical protein